VIPSTWLQLLPLVPALPLLGVAVLVLGGRRLPDRVAATVAVGVVGLAFLVAVAVGAAYLGPGAPERAEAGVPEGPTRPPVVQRLWQWMAVGDDLVTVSAALRPVAAGQAVPAGAVGEMWASPWDPRVAPRLRDMWSAAAVPGQRAGDAGLAPYAIVGIGDVAPDPGPFVAARPKLQHRFQVDVALQLDGLSLVMILLVTGVGFLILAYSAGYMRGDPGLRRFFLYMDLFVFSMLVLVLAADFLVLFVGWELVGLCSYLLIGFWHQDVANASAGRKAFVVNRVGDFAFLLGLLLVWTVFGSLAFADVLPNAGRLLPLGGALATAITLLLLLGATGKSAQLPLYVWLPDAMAGPTPVSALIHAATMVTAGVYLIARAAPLFERAPLVMLAIAGVGAATALAAALIALVQVDIKRVLAYSTISQLGFMFLAVGAGAYIAGIAHLVVHAFFKALLFLAAGSVMHALAHGYAHAGVSPPAQDDVPAQQDVRRMGGLLRRLPLTAWTFVIGGLALAGLFPLAGFFSKDEILYETLGRGQGLLDPWVALWAVGMVTAFLTALYAGRLLLLVCGGGPRGEGAGRAVEPSAVMTAPLVALAALTVAGGLLIVPLAGREAPLAALLAPVLGQHHAVGDPSKAAVAVAATAASLLGLGLAWLAYGRGALDPARIARAAPWAYRLAWRKFYVDELYALVFVRPFRAAAPFLWRVVDDRVIDGAVNATGRAVLAAGTGARRLQTGYVRSYALFMLLGAAVIAAYLLLSAR